MLITTGSAPFKARKGRTATVRPSTNLLINSSAEDNSEAVRLQRLLRYGIVGDRAKLIADAVWGEARHG